MPIRFFKAAAAKKNNFVKRIKPTTHERTQTGPAEYSVVEYLLRIMLFIKFGHGHREQTHNPYEPECAC